MSAVISACGRYRYQLTRAWGAGPRLAFVMLNPSTANASTDDPTIRRCARFARDAGYDGLLVGNLFAWRATNPLELRTVADPIGPENDTALAEIVSMVSMVVCAWGSRGTFQKRDERVLRLIRNAGREPQCLRVSTKGFPEHPLYLPACLRPIPMPPDMRSTP